MEEIRLSAFGGIFGSIAKACLPADRGRKEGKGCKENI
jgi:hypothetical protein